MRDQPHITLPDVARLLRVPYRRAYELLLIGAFTGKKIAGQWHIDPASLKDYLDRQGAHEDISQ